MVYAKLHEGKCLGSGITVLCKAIMPLSIAYNIPVVGLWFVVYGLCNNSDILITQTKKLGI